MPGKYTYVIRQASGEWRAVINGVIQPKRYPTEKDAYESISRFDRLHVARKVNKKTRF